MAGLGYKVWAAGDVLAAADVMGYLMSQAVQVYDDASARTTALGTAVSEGMLSYLKDTNSVEVYNGSAWAGIDTTISSINATAVINTLTSSTATAYTVASTDQSTILQFTGASAVITIGTATAFTAGQRVDIIDDGGGMTISAESTAIALYGAGTAGTAYTVGNQYEAVTVIGLGTNAYRIIGNITAA